MQAEDFHFYTDPKTALQNGDIFILTGFHVLPRRGGWMDQDYFEAQDLMTYLRGYTWAKRQHKPQKTKGGFDPLDFEQPGAVTNHNDFIN